MIVLKYTFNLQHKQKETISKLCATWYVYSPADISCGEWVSEFQSVSQSVSQSHMKILQPISQHIISVIFDSFNIYIYICICICICICMYIYIYIYISTSIYHFMKNYTPLFKMVVTYNILASMDGSVHLSVRAVDPSILWKTDVLWQCPSVCPSVRPSVCPSVRPRFPEILIWNLVYALSRWHDMSSLSCITIGSRWPSLQPKVGQTHFLQ